MKTRSPFVLVSWIYSTSNFNQYICSNFRNMAEGRFSSIKRDPRFRGRKEDSSHANSQTKIDPRFAEVLHNDDFKSRRVYKLKGSESDNGDETAEAHFFQREIIPGVYDPARGIGVESSSESESEESDEENNVDSILHDWNFNDDNVAKDVNASSSVLALCNFDADEISAEDIYMLLQSFLPLNGSLKSVKVFISNYGKEKIAEEASEGPIALKVENNGQKDLELNEKDASEKVRMYQAQRLKYFYAIIVCSDQETAAHLYEVCDGLEFESSATFVDLRFVPEEETFDDSVLKEEYNSGATAKKYAPNTYQNKALSHQKADLTWEGEDRRRKEVLKKKVIKDIELDDYNAFLASSSSEDENENITAEQNLAQKKALLLGDAPTVRNEQDNMNQKKRRRYQAESNEKSITIQLSKEEVEELKDGHGLSDSEDTSSDVESGSESNSCEVREQNTKEQEEGKSNDLSLLLADVEDEDRKHFDYNKIVKVEKMSEKSRKRKNVKPIDSFHIDTNDARFKALFENPEFAIDPSDPKFKSTNAMREIVSKRAQFRAKQPIMAVESLETKKTPNSSITGVIDHVNNSQPKQKLSALVQSLKTKTAMHKSSSAKRLK